MKFINALGVKLVDTKDLKTVEECLESIDEYLVLLNTPHFCKKVYCYLNPIGEVK